ncbi:MAG: helix-turn-helix domain-containing protein, partial [Neofamilia sp.]
MYFYLNKFGLQLKKFRKERNFTQKFVEENSGVSISTLNRIENGRSLPDYRVLDDLSVLYRIDLLNVLIRYRISDPSTLSKSITDSEYSIEINNLDQLQKNIENLIRLKRTNKNNYFQKHLENHICLYNGILNFRMKKYDIAYNLFIELLCNNILDFKIDFFDSFKYNEIEIRALMNIGIIFQKQKKLEKYLEILLFCFDNNSENSKSYRDLCHNISLAYYYHNNYVESLRYNNLHFELCRQYNDYGNIPFIYYNQG